MKDNPTAAVERPVISSLSEAWLCRPESGTSAGPTWVRHQALYIITQSHMFAAAMAGAPVVNMFAAYGGIRWGSGLARAYQYEKTQSRIGKSIWDSPNQYMENSHSSGSRA